MAAIQNGQRIKITEVDSKITLLLILDYDYNIGKKREVNLEIVVNIKIDFDLFLFFPNRILSICLEKEK